jgi:dephospho-CoA kinase
MSVFAVTGNLSSGKTKVLTLLKKKGAFVFDADKRVHQFYKNRSGPVYGKIASVFPQAVNKQGTISRKKLGEIVFSDVRALRKLEGIIHPVIIEDLKHWVSKVKGERGVYIAEVPLLFEKKLDGYFNGVILVKTKRKILIERIRMSFGISEAEAVKRLSLFLPVKEKEKKAKFVIDNSFDVEKLRKEVEMLWERLTS